MEQQSPLSNQFEIDAALNTETTSYPINGGSPELVSVSEAYEQTHRELIVLEKALADIKDELNAARMLFADDEIRKARRHVRREYRAQKSLIDDDFGPVMKELYQLRYDVDERIRVLQEAKFKRLEKIQIRKQHAITNWQASKQQHYARLQKLLESERQTEVKIFEWNRKKSQLFSKARLLYRRETRRSGAIQAATYQAEQNHDYNGYPGTETARI